MGSTSQNHWKLLIQAWLYTVYRQGKNIHFHKFDRGSGLVVLWRTTCLVKQALPAWSQTLEFGLDPEVRTAFPVAKRTSPYIEAADSQRALHSWLQSCCAVLLLLLCFPARSKQGCYLALLQPRSLAQATDVLGHGTAVCSRGYRSRRFSKGQCHASAVSGVILFVWPMANACISRYEYMLLLRPHMALRDTRQMDLMHV